MQFRKETSLRAAVSVCLLAFCASASALPVALTTDVMIIDPASGGNATQADGAFSGNDKPSNALNDLNTLDVFGLGLTWSLEGSSDATGGGPFLSNPGGTSGTLTFDDPIDDPFVIALKAANTYSLYYFENTLGGAKSLSFITDGVALNPKGSPQALSHASLYLTDGSKTPDPDPGPDPKIAVNPEPSTALLAVLGALGLAGRRRRA